MAFSTSVQAGLLVLSSETSENRSLLRGETNAFVTIVFDATQLTNDCRFLWIPLAGFLYNNADISDMQNGSLRMDGSNVVSQTFNIGPNETSGNGKEMWFSHIIQFNDWVTIPAGTIVKMTLRAKLSSTAHGQYRWIVPFNMNDVMVVYDSVNATRVQIATIYNYGPLVFPASPVTLNFTKNSGDASVALSFVSEPMVDHAILVSSNLVSWQNAAILSGNASGNYAWTNTPTWDKVFYRVKVAP